MKEITLNFLSSIKKIRYLLIFNPISMILFCLLPTVESRRGLFRYKLKEVISMKLDQIIDFFKSLISSSKKAYFTKKFRASYLGHKKVAIAIPDSDKFLLERSDKVIKVGCLIPNGQELLFPCSVCDDYPQGVNVNFWCFAPKNLKLLSNPKNIWYVHIYFPYY
ncbi:MAG TPA: hypothetical protein PKZ92_01035 [Candidatus Woesebacteria bacterium]|nr:hypothetical protein [Candidatus Woesebacteria bacterium]